MFGPDLYMRTIGLVDWAIILWSLVGWGLLAGVVGPKPTVPTLLFQLEVLLLLCVGSSDFLVDYKFHLCRDKW